MFLKGILIFKGLTVRRLYKSFGVIHQNITDIDLFFMSLHVQIHFVVSPPGCDRSVTDFWGWDAHKAQFYVLLMILVMICVSVEYQKGP
jgi:hypothetical protein